MIVTEGGGTASFGAPAAGVPGCDGLLAAGGVSSAAQELAAASAAKAIANNANRHLARIRPPEIRINGASVADGRRVARARSASWNLTAFRYQPGSALKVRILCASASHERG